MLLNLLLSQQCLLGHQKLKALWNTSMIELKASLLFFIAVNTASQKNSMSAIFRWLFLIGLPKIVISAKKQLTSLNISSLPCPKVWGFRWFMLDAAIASHLIIFALLPEQRRQFEIGKHFAPYALTHSLTAFLFLKHWLAPL